MHGAKIFGTDYDGVIINIEPQKALAFGEIMQRYWNVDRDEAATLWMATGGTSRRTILSLSFFISFYLPRIFP